MGYIRSQQAEDSRNIGKALLTQVIVGLNLAG
jgi:hypothetical protein